MEQATTIFSAPFKYYLSQVHEVSLPIGGGARRGGRGMGDGADPERNRYQQGMRDTVKMQVRPRLRVQSEKLQCVSGLRLPVCKARTSLPDSMTVVLPPHRVRLFFALRVSSEAGGGVGGAAAGEGQGLGAQRPSQPSGLRGEQGREADKARPAPSPTAAFQKGGGRRARGRWEEEKEYGGARKGRREGAAGGTGQDRAEEGGEGGGAGRPRRAGRREGFLKPKINKLFLFTCGVGGGGEGGE